MRHHDVHFGPRAEPAETLPEIELRILSGCHQGASLDLAAGAVVHVGSEGDCDVLLSDCGLDADAPLQVSWRGGRWFVRAAQDEAHEAHGHGAGALPGVALGAPALIGQVHVTVCAAHLDWSAVELARPAPRADATPLPEDGAECADAAPADEAPLQADAPPPAAALARAAPARRLLALPAVGLLALALLGTGWAVWRHAPDSAPVNLASHSPAALQLSPQAQERAVKEASLAIALADPALRMRVVANAQGGVTVSGWVDSAEQFDRLAQALSSLRPLPRLAVRTAQEVFDALTDVGTAQGLSLRFAPMGAGKVQVRGVVLTPELQQRTLVQLRQRAPEGIEILDGLRVAAQQGPEVVRWLGAQGLTVRRADWDGEQLVLTVEVTPAQRQQLERLLAQAQTPLSDVPFVLQTQLVKEAAAARRLSLAEAGLPFGIRSVVGGDAPYVVLADGAKLQPGGARAGWRLAAIAPDHLVFDSPRRLEVSR